MILLCLILVRERNVSVLVSSETETVTKTEIIASKNVYKNSNAKWNGKKHNTNKKPSSQFLAK